MMFRSHLRRRAARTSAAIALTLALPLAFAGCSTGSTPQQPGASAPGTTLQVFAAASLKSSFNAIAQDFEAAHPGTKVALTYNGSSTLVDQLKGGAPADVFASADEKNMKKATDASLVETPHLFASNTLTLVVAPGNPKKITGLDASLDGVKLVVCAKGVPCGNATETLAANLKVTPKPVSAEQSVTDVLGKVTSGEADAGVVYATDAKSAGDKVATVAIPGAEKVVNRYPIATVKASKNVEVASEFVRTVLDAKSQATLADAGFGKP